MRKISIKDFGPINSATIDLDGLVVLSGPHGVGKSMVLEALMIGLYGQVGRVRRKADLPDLIRAGTRLATINLEWDSFQNEVKIKPTTKTCTSNSMPAAGGLQTNDPWANLSIQPASWRALLPPATINMEAVKDLVVEFPEAVRNLVLRSCKKGIVGLLDDLEAERLEAHRSVQDVPQVKDTAEIDGQTIFLPDYAPFLDDYEAKVRDILARTGEYQRKIHERQVINSRYVDVKATLKAQHASCTSIRSLITRECRLEYIRALDVVLTPTAKLCDTCKRPWNPEYDGAKALMGTLREQTTGLIDPDYRHKYACSMRGLRKVVKQYEKIIAEPMPTEPEQVGKWNDLVVALKTRNYMLENQKRILAKNLDAAELKRNIQAAVSLFRKPETLQKITPTDTISIVVDRLRESCILLKIPVVSLNKELETEFEVSDGSRRPCSLMSDAQRAMAGMAIAEAVAFATKTTDFLLVDKLDWVEGEHINRLTEFLLRAATWAKTVLVLTAKETICPKDATAFQGIYTASGTEFSLIGTW